MGPKPFSAEPLCGPQDWCYCTPRCATRKNQLVDPSPAPAVSNAAYPEESAYRREQTSLRAAGFDAYSSDNVDEFPSW